jgi:hypothetical protein
VALLAIHVGMAFANRRLTHYEPVGGRVLGPPAG